VIDLYARLVSRCRTINHLNRVHIALAEHLTPAEMALLRAEIPPPSVLWSGALSSTLGRRRGLVGKTVRRLRPRLTFPNASYEWLDEMERLLAKSGKPSPERFVRRRVAPNVQSFSDGGAKAGKTLVLGFTGLARRLFMPIPVFLQHLDAERFDLLLLRDPSRRGFRDGLEGVAGGLEGTLDAVGALVRRDDYRAVVALGTSGGGLPAVLTALRLGLDKAVSVSGRGPCDPRWQAVGGDALLADLAARAGAEPNVLLVHAADSEPDAVSARSLAAVVPARTFVVRAAGGAKVGHNALHPLLLESRLAAFLAMALDPDVLGCERDADRTPGRIQV
jgi:hypothetical protein